MKWTAAESKDLMRLVSRGFKVDRIAELHQRSVVSIRMQIDRINGCQKPYEHYITPAAIKVGMEAATQ